MMTSLSVPVAALKASYESIAVTMVCAMEGGGSDEVGGRPRMATRECSEWERASAE